MHSHPDPKSAFFTVRAALAVALCSLSVSIGYLSFASTPSTGTISVANPVASYDAGPFTTPNLTPVIQVQSWPTCDATLPCDSYTLTVDLPSGYIAANPNASVKVTMFWTDTGSGSSDYDLYIYDGVKGNVGSGDPAPYSSASGANPEVANITPLHDGTSKYTIKIVPYTPSAETLHVRMELLAGSGPAGFPGFGQADPTVSGNPRYMNFYAPAGSSAEAGSGEFNIGFNPATKRIMAMNTGPIWRLTPPEVRTPALPEICAALWEDKSSGSTDTGVDPILWTDQVSGRTFASNFTGGTTALYAYSDSDGEPTLTQPTGWTNVNAGLPNASSDHQTIGSGPYPAGVVNPNPTINQGRAVYYCAQGFPVGTGTCQRSDDLGVTFGPAVLAYDGTIPDGGGCRALHGHVHVAPDGTIYLPVADCSTATADQTGFVVSTNGGANWTEKYIPDSPGQNKGSDPSIAIDANNKIYFFYIRANPDVTEGHMMVRTSTDRGDNWSAPVDLGATHGIINSAFPQSVGGDAGRVAVGFLGTDRSGDMQSLSFPGIWYAFVATTFDGGATWTTVNVSPNDPVQGLGGIWQSGGSHTNRNLLDFNEISIDDKGRPLFGYNDGCVGDCLGDPSLNSFTAFMRIARQTGGRTLFASQDAFVDAAGNAILPKAACLSGNRDQYASHLHWKAPDNGGANITNYEIYRSTSAGFTPGAANKIGETGNEKTAYTDTTADPNVSNYYYVVKAVNSIGTGPASNEINLLVVPLPPPESICLGAGVTKLTDALGDTSVTVIGLIPTPAPPGSDLLSVQVAQPYQADSIPRLTFTLNTDPNPTGTAPAFSAWYIAMRIPGPDPAVPGDASSVHYRGVRMAFANSPTPTFQSYTPNPNSGGGVDGRFVKAGSTKNTEPGSNYDGPNGKITFIVKLSDLGLNPGDVINGFVSGVSQSTAAGTPTLLYDQMPNSLSFANSYTLSKTEGCSATGAVSRKVHGTAGAFDILLPGTGTIGIEPRSGGANNAYTLVFAFNSPVLLPGTPSLVQGNATFGTPAVGPNPNQVTLPLMNVTNAQHLVVSLTGAQDTASVVLPTLTARMDVLVADTNADTEVNSGDISQTKSQSGQLVANSNFREDVNADGDINSGDISLVKSRSGTALPPAPAQSATASNTGKRRLPGNGRTPQR